MSTCGSQEALTSKKLMQIAVTQAIFNKHDPKGRGFLSQAQLRHLLKGVGLNVETKDLKLLFGRIDHDATNSVSRYLAHVDLELDIARALCAHVLAFSREFQVLCFQFFPFVGAFLQKVLAFSTSSIRL